MKEPFVERRLAPKQIVDPTALRARMIAEGKIKPASARQEPSLPYWPDLPMLRLDREGKREAARAVARGRRGEEAAMPLDQREAA